jgi:hypothetical protein
MFDNAQTLYQKYVKFINGQPNLIVGVDIRDQSLPFMFEVFENSQIKEQYILPLNPEAYRIIHGTRAVATMTQGGAFEDNIGLSLKKISLTGTWGYIGTLPGSHARNLQGVQQDSWQWFKDMETMFLSFYERFGTYDLNGNPVKSPVDMSTPPELRFYNYTDRDYFKVQLNKFEVQRHIQKRFLYQYDIQMTVLGRIDSPTTDEEDILGQIAAINAQEIARLQTTTSLWQNVLKGYGYAYGQMSNITNAMELLGQDLDLLASTTSAFQQGVTDFIEAPFALIDRAISTVDTIVDSLTDTDDIPDEFIIHCRDTKRHLCSLSLRPDRFKVSDEATGTAAVNTTPAALEIMTAPLPDGQTAATYGIVQMDNPETTIFDPTQTLTAEIAVREAPITIDDSIEAISHRTLGNALDWKRLAVLNDLEYPFIVATREEAYSEEIGVCHLMQDVDSGWFGETLFVGDMPKEGYCLFFPQDIVQVETVVELPDNQFIASFTAPITQKILGGEGGPAIGIRERKLSVLMPGDKMLIPGDGVEKSILSSSGDALNAKLYGIDEQLDADGNQSADNTSDIQTITGIDNLCMQLRHRMMTIRGELAGVGHPSYGTYLPLIIGKAGIDFWYERALLECRLAVLEDPRIERIGKADFRIENTAIYFEAEVYPVYQTQGEQISILVN